jgi:hypothetical protein
MRLGDWRTGVRFLVGPKGLSPLQNVHTSSGALPSSCPIGNAHVSGIKRPGSETETTHFRLVPS